MNSQGCTGITARPYQLLCAVCSIGQSVTHPENDRVRRLMEAVRADPDIPVTVMCNAGIDSLFGFQDPGADDDTPEGTDYNQKRDLDILHRLDLPPGVTLPARILFKRLLERIPTVAGICGYDTVTSNAWRGCTKSKSGYYEKARATGISVIIPPRPCEEMQQEKEKSIAALRTAKEINMRPHLLLCAVCQYGKGIRPPFAEDNLPEFLDIVFNENPNILMTLVKGADWLMCAPCPSRAPDRNACFTGRNCCGGLYNQIKDLNVLQALGLTYGTKITAGDFYRLALARIPGTEFVCALDNAGLPPYSLWWNACDAQQTQTGYRTGRELLLKMMSPPDHHS
jgi:hypothetical protein